jgi:lactoylglutathione lyase
MSFSGRYLHTMLNVVDLERSIDFYVRLLGMRELRRGAAPDEGRKSVFLGYGEESNATVLELTQRDSLRSLDHGTAFGHLAIGTEDVRAACGKLAQMGATIKRAPFALPNGLVVAFLSDPDGYEIELVERP